MNHQTAPVEVREQFAIPEARLPEAVKALASYPGVEEGMIVSTCNRVELLARTTNGSRRSAGLPAPVLRLRSRRLIASISTNITSDDAVRHVFRVASSLDSMVVGEPQILGQVKEAYATARAVGAVNSQLDALLTRAFAVAKRVRNETAIATSAVSVASVAVDLAKKIFGNLQGQERLPGGRGQDVRAGGASPAGAWRRANLRRQSHLRARGGAGEEVQWRGDSLRAALRDGRRRPTS